MTLPPTLGGRTAGREMNRATRKRVIVALKLAILKAEERNQTYWVNVFREMLQQAEIGLDIERLEETRPVLTAILGYDPLGGDADPGEPTRPATARAAGSPETPSLQDLRRKIYTKAKAEPAWRFWGLYVHISKLGTLREAYRLAKANNGTMALRASME